MIVFLEIADTDKVFSLMGKTLFRVRRVFGA